MVLIWCRAATKYNRDSSLLLLQMTDKYWIKAKLRNFPLIYEVTTCNMLLLVSMSVDICELHAEAHWEWRKIKDNIQNIQQYHMLITLIYLCYNFIAFLTVNIRGYILVCLVPCFWEESHTSEWFSAAVMVFCFCLVFCFITFMMVQNQNFQPSTNRVENRSTIM